MTEGTEDWIVADSEDEDGFQPLQIADQSNLLSGNPFSTGPEKIPDPSLIQTASFITSPARTPQRERTPDISNASLFTPPPVYQHSPPNASPLLPLGADALVPKSKPRPRPVPRKSRTTNTIYDDFLIEDASRSSGSLISSASAIPSNTLAADSIRPPTTPSAVSEFIEEVNPTFSIADRAKTRSRKTQAKKPTYVPVDPNVIELSSDSDIDELSLRPPRKQQKSQDKPVKPKPRPKAKPKSKARKSPSPKVAERVSVDTRPSDLVTLPAPQEPVLSSQLPSTASHLSLSFPPLPELSSPPSSPPVITRKRKRAPPLEPDLQGEDMDIDVPSGSSPSIVAPPLFSPQSPSVVPPIDNSHTLEEETGNAEIIATGNKRQKKDTKSSTVAKGKKKSRKQADEIELENIAHKSPPDEAATRKDDLVEDDFAEEEVPKVTSKKKAPLKSKPAAKSKPKPKGKGKGKAILSESENEEDDNSPRSKSPSQGNHLPEDEESRGGSPRNPQAIGVAETTKKNSPQSVTSPSKQTPSTGLKSRAFNIKSKSTPMSELIRRVNSQPNSPFANGPSYSPLIKSSRTMLSRIAPLHPNRRTPPPPLPRPPPPKKSKKQLEMEERIEEELSETVEGWSCMTDEERRNLRRGRIDAELGYE
ncbi:hypothetical protein DEU56DRAFT_863996 [Suillus clintonianus]|uniref:uncharacterized protein n=1 Tax=Suillus clintonianus TaxID=1904413 RepID=UPI001B88728C|nr:uncharacterized protein DEU56DRAFT_863996 [Suillus clintonianus]KAG2123475.1 hypothetical protein DEU56DRAFT_863996 [Suillus clintonianus]